MQVHILHFHNPSGLVPFTTIIIEHSAITKEEPTNLSAALQRSSSMQKHHVVFSKKSLSDEIMNLNTIHT